MARSRRRVSWQSGATIKDVAREAGVSSMTVSRVLNKVGSVRDETRERVMAAVKALDYKPNFSARSLAKARSFQLGLFYDNPSAGYISEFLTSAVRACREQRYHLVLENCGATEDDWADAIENNLAEANYDGIIILPPVSDFTGVIDAIEARGIPFVRIAPTLESASAHSITINDEQAAQQMTAAMIAEGHTRIGFIKGHPDHGASEARLRGFMAAHEEAKLELDSELMVQGYFSYRSGLEGAESLLNLDARPTAIFASNDDMAAGALAAAHRFRMNVPEELSVVGFDDTPLARAVWPALTTMRQPIADMAESAVEVLIQSLSSQRTEADRVPPQHRVLPCELIERESLVPPARD